MTSVAILGSTGSIGTQTIDVIQAESERYEIGVLAAGSSIAELAAQANKWQPPVVAIADTSRAQELQQMLPTGTELHAGEHALAEVAATCDIAVNGIVGFAGLHVTLAVLAGGKRLALANKESLIAAGPVVAQVRNTPGAELIPVDSEHGAIHQCLRSMASPTDLHSVTLTASGGPFRGKTRTELEKVTLEEALAHPTWAMGPKITVDSSTLMNKGLEVIEAHELFGVDYDNIEVVVHPQSIVHSMANFTDGTTIAQLSLPDMRLPIAYALAYPDRIGTPFGRMDFTKPFTLEFEPPDVATFRCLELAYAAGRSGGTAPAWLSAANEVIVDAFLDGAITWISIAELLEAALVRWDGSHANSVDDVLAADAAARRVAQELLKSEGRAS